MEYNFLLWRKKRWISICRNVDFRVPMFNKINIPTKNPSFLGFRTSKGANETIIAIVVTMVT